MIILLVFSVNAITLPWSIEFDWINLEHSLEFTLAYDYIKYGYIGLGFKDISGKNNMDHSDLWIFDLENKSVSDYKGDGNGYPILDYKNNLLGIKFHSDKNIITWKRMKKTDDVNDIELYLRNINFFDVLGILLMEKLLVMDMEINIEELLR